MTTKEENYSQWWIEQFPCDCGHEPDDHFLAPVDGECRACKECHGEGGGILRMGTALVQADIDCPEILGENKT